MEYPCCDFVAREILKGYHRSSKICFVSTNTCIHFDELVSPNAAVGPYKNNSFNKYDKTINIYLLLHFMDIIDK